MRQILMGGLMLALLGVTGEALASEKKSAFAKSDPQFAEYEKMLERAFAGWGQLGTCSLIELTQEDTGAEPLYQGRCEFEFKKPFCFIDYRTKRCYSGKVLGIATRVKFKSKGKKATLNWQNFFYDGGEKPVVFVLYHYKFKKDDGGVWQSKGAAQQALVFDLPD